MTDQRARAVERAEQVIRDVHKDLPDIWLGGRQRYVLVEAIATALADERRRALEEAAGIAEMFSINKQRIHPDIAWDNMSESARTVCHMTCQNIALAIRAKAHAGQEG